MQDPTSDVQLEEQPSPDLSIMELGLPTRARNVLLGAGINTVNDALAALEKGDETLTDLKGFGSRSLTDLKKRLQEHGFPLPGEAISPLQALGSLLEKELL
jgi:DNA-directed RNA polymerase alpha subunit